MLGNFSETSIRSCETLLSSYDFTRCQRPDGTFYGTGGTCRKGMPVEIQRVETGLFVIRNAKGENIGMISAPGALRGGGGIRGGGVRTAYDVKLTTPDGKKHSVDRIPTLAAAKAKVRSLMGETSKGGDAKAIAQGGLTKKGKASRLRNLADKIEEAQDDLKSAKESVRELKKSMSPEEFRSNSRVRSLLIKAKSLTESLDALAKEKEAVSKAPEID